ncbi:MAG: Hypothetical protein C75L2_00780002 [Leptospirillum sp. Group II 'C75']|jgi:hypothetical protein|uniref:PEP-CTERM sorting domain-containing protein n=1 Tax=Leptospirillum sp. Group II 'CF-1' TaxID=1660083 RepID=UPI0000F0CC07|nr:PEP-CTERM sorting domain-containing protein [Leptospirillum sp. Group II 'CF-1']EAY57487.1 MAG: hypothetical protein UBAL2_79310327 [Leptospirillum rubarum]EIJ75802.1 MAG: Hypothetical protein C75L2_00780002 [Leptospirillum sp. Group II 'C75']
MRERIFFPSVFMALMMGLLIRTSAAWALIPVVPFSPQEDVSVMTENAVCTPCPVTTSRQVMNAATSISVTSASPTASASISLPAAGLPDLSVFAGNESGTSSTANAEYINTIRFVYTGSGPAPATLSSAIGWTVDATVLSQPGLSSFDIGGGASIGVSLSSCYCPEQFVSDNIVGSGTFTLSNPFTIPNGGTIAYRTDLAAFVYNSGGLTGSVSIDPQVSLTLPQGWTGYLGSGGVLGGPVLSATPEPSSLILLGTFLAVWGGRRLAQRERLSSGEVEAGR